MDVLIYISTLQEPIKANIPDFSAKDFSKDLNGPVMFISLGGNVINRNLIQMIIPA